MSMKFFQPEVPPLPADIDLSGKTVIVTGATSGIGLEAARQFVGFGVSSLVLAVRNTAKGEAVKKALLADPDSHAAVTVLRLDAEDYSSVLQFVAAFTASFQDLHILVANAGIGTYHKEMAPTGHEKVMQVNYLSNVLLTLGLLPVLEATARKTGVPTKVTWTGSRQYSQGELALTDLRPGTPSGPSGPGTPASPGSLFNVVDTPDTVMGRYGNSKLCCLLFQRELAQHYPPDRVVVNSFCPGFVRTSMTDEMPLLLRVLTGVMSAIRARPVEKGGAIAVYAAAVAGPETHGKLLCDMELEEPLEFVTSRQGELLQKALWNETVDEMAGRLDEAPSWWKRV